MNRVLFHLAYLWLASSFVPRIAVAQSPLALLTAFVEVAIDAPARTPRPTNSWPTMFCWTDFPSAPCARNASLSTLLLNTQNYRGAYGIEQDTRIVIMANFPMSLQLPGGQQSSFGPEHVLEALKDLLSFQNVGPATLTVEFIGRFPGGSQFLSNYFPDLPEVSELRTILAQNSVSLVVKASVHERNPYSVPLINELQPYMNTLNLGSSARAVPSLDAGECFHSAGVPLYTSFAGERECGLDRPAPIRWCNHGQGITAKEHCSAALIGGFTLPRVVPLPPSGVQVTFGTYTSPGGGYPRYTKSQADGACPGERPDFRLVAAIAESGMVPFVPHTGPTVPIWTGDAATILYVHAPTDFVNRTTYRVASPDNLGYLVCASGTPTW